MSKNKRKNPAPSYTSPIRSSKGCLCDDNTYHIDCCDGTLWGQGVGKTEKLDQIYKKFKFNIII